MADCECGAVTGGDGGEEVLKVLPGEGSRVGDPLLLVHHDVARGVVCTVTEFLYLETNTSPRMNIQFNAAPLTR